ncbi:MAG: hypothetical protein ACRDT0_00090 [Pseudonocardiaceae bacterium]
MGRLAELLRSPAERAEGAALLVVGPSGCGKSSLVRAGLRPVLGGEPGWRTLSPILPGADPVAALARELAAMARRSTLNWTIDHVHHQLGQHGLTGLADELLPPCRPGPTPCVRCAARHSGPGSRWTTGWWTGWSTTPTVGSPPAAGVHPGDVSDVRFSEMCRLVQAPGVELQRVSGSHHISFTPPSRR